MCFLSSGCIENVNRKKADKPCSFFICNVCNVLHRCQLSWDPNQNFPPNFTLVVYPEIRWRRHEILQIVLDSLGISYWRDFQIQLAWLHWLHYSICSFHYNSVWASVQLVFKDNKMEHAPDKWQQCRLQLFYSRNAKLDIPICCQKHAHNPIIRWNLWGNLREPHTRSQIRVLDRLQYLTFRSNISHIWHQICQITCREKLHQIVDTSSDFLRTLCPACNRDQGTSIPSP